MVQWVWGSESRYNAVCKDLKKTVFIIRLCLPFVLFSRRVIPHTVSLLRGCYAAVTSPPFLFLPRLTCHTGLFLNNTKLNEAVEIHAASLPSAGTFFPVAYTQFMSNYGCQCGREIGEAFICPLAWFSISSMLLSSSLPVQVITAHLNA